MKPTTPRHPQSISLETLEPRLLLATNPVLSLGAVTSSTVNLSWDSIGGATAVRVYVAPAPSATQGAALPHEKLIATLPSSAVSYEFTGLAPGVDTFFRIEVDQGGSETGATNTYAKTIGGPDVPLDTPIREVHAYGKNILEIVTSDTQLNKDMVGNSGVAWQEGVWTIKRLDGSSVDVLQVYRHSIPMQAPSYSSSSGNISNDVITVDHRLFLVLDEDLGNEDVFTITGPMSTSFVLPYSDEYLETPIVQLNQVGYSPRATERWAYVSGWMGDGGSLVLTGLPPTADVLIEPSDPMTVRSTELANLPVTVRSVYDSDTGGEVRQIDLASLPAAEGVKYRIHIPGVGVSWVTAVSEEAVFKVYYLTSRALFHDRWAGDLDEAYTDWVRPPDHTTVFTGERPIADMYYQQDDPQTGERPMVGGYHDAGDYDQYTVHTTIAQDMLDAFNLNSAAFTDSQLTIPESGNGIPDQLDQALWGIEGWIDLQEADGGVRAGVQSYRHPKIGYANEDPDPYWTFAREPNTTARCATLFAVASRLVAPYDSNRATDLRARAISAYAWAKNNGAPSSLLLGGAGELWKLTGTGSYKTDFETYWDAGAFNNYNRMQQAQNALPDFVLGYVTTAGARSDIVASVTNSLNADADNSRISTDNDHAHRNPRPAGGNMSWGNGTSMGRWLDPMMVRMQMGSITPELQQDYFNTISLSADYILGANPFGYSWISELGSRHPDEVLWADSLAFKADGYGQIPGMGVYGLAGGYSGTWTQSARAAFYPELINNIETSGDFGSEWPLAYRYGDTRLLVESTEFTVHQVQAPTIELFANLVKTGITPPSSWLPGGADVRNPLPGGMTPFNEGPNVEAGPNQGVAIASGASLSGTVADDNFSGSLTYTWSKVSGPGTVTFGTASQVDTTADFSAAGRYVLRLTSSDGSIAKSDDVVVDVSVADEFKSDYATIGMWDFNGDINDSAWMSPNYNGTTLNLTSHGGATLSSANLGWMGTPSGQALRVSNVGDYVDVTIPDRLVQAGSSAKPISIEARFYIADYKAYAIGNYTLFALSQSYDAQFGVSQSTWDQTAHAGASSGGVLASTSTWDAAVSKNAWHLLQITFDSAALASLYIDGNLVGSVTAANNYGRTNDWTLTLGNFDGYIDDVRVSNIVRGHNVAPVVSAGSDQNILKAQTTALDGTVTDDGLPTSTVTATWSKVSGPGTVTFGNVNAVDTTATFSAGGTYVLRLTASDGSLSTSDDVTINVVNQRPAVNAGSDQDHVGLTVDLSGTASDDGLPSGSVTYTWSKLSGPGSVTFGNANSLSTTATFSLAARYVLRLTASDGSQSGYDDLTIIARPANAYEYSNDGNTTALYHLNSDFTDSSGNGYTLTASGNAELADDNMDWMSSPSGKALRIYAVGDSLTVGIPDSAIMPGSSASELSIEVRFFVDNYMAYAVANTVLISLTQDYDSYFSLGQGMWDDPRVAKMSSASTSIVSNSTWDSNVLTDVWHTLRITFGTDALVSCYVDGNLLGSATRSQNYGRTTNWNLTLGNFDGYIDEVRISNVVRVDVNNDAPQVNAGDDQTITLPAGAALDGAVTDDGLPNPPASLTYTWSQQSGPGTVTFANASAVDTTASFSMAGTYVLRLTSSDSALSNNDEVTITVNPAFVGYTTDFSTDESADFASWVQIGQTGDTGANEHANLSWTGGDLTLTGRYGHDVGVLLTTTGTQRSGLYGVYDDVEAFVQYRYNNAAPALADVGMSVRQAGTTSNTYPLYRVDILSDGTNTTLAIREHSAWNDVCTLTSQAVSLAGGANVYKLFLSATDDGSGNVDLVAKLWEGETLLSTLTVTDHAKAGSEEWSADWDQSGNDIKVDGWVGFYGGSHDGGSTWRGIDVVGFSAGTYE